MKPSLYLIIFAFCSLFPAGLSMSQDIQENSDLILIPGTSSVDRNTAGLKVTNNKKDSISLKVTVNHEEVLLLTINPGKEVYIYSIVENSEEVKNIKFDHVYDQGSDSSKAVSAYLVVNEGHQKPMTFSNDLFLLPDKQRCVMFDKEFRFTTIKNVLVESAKKVINK